MCKIKKKKIRPHFHKKKLYGFNITILFKEIFICFSDYSFNINIETLTVWFVSPVSGVVLVKTFY